MIPEIIYFELWRILSKRVTLKQILFLTKRQASEPRGSCYATVPRRVGSPHNPAVTLWSAVVPSCRTKRDYCSRNNYWASHLAADKLLLGLSSNSHLPKVFLDKRGYLPEHLEPTHQEARQPLTKGLCAGKTATELGDRLLTPTTTVMPRDISCQRLPKQLREDQAQATAAVTLKPMTAAPLIDPRLYFMV